MRLRASPWIAALAMTLALGACGKTQSTVERVSEPTTPSAALVPPPSSQPAEATQSNGAAAKITRSNEDGSETADESTAEGGSRNPLLAAVASTVTGATSAAAAATTAAPAASPWVEGTNYTRLVPAQPTSAAAGQVEVTEFFWYGCPHCYAIDPLVESWRKTKPAYIVFTRVPVMWSEAHRSTARLYYTLDSLGKLDQLHGEVFKEIHVNGNPLIAADPNDSAGAERVQAAFVQKFGISDDAFKKAYHSFGVETSLQRADQLVQRYRIEGVPTFVVNGKFVADVRSAGGPEKLLSLVADLAAQEHKH